ncbi:hypothetical protein OROMI_032058 [Orobanche minor]
MRMMAKTAFDPRFKSGTGAGAGTSSTGGGAGGDAPMGLFNYGGSCYLNSTLQFLLSLKVVKDLVRSQTATPTTLEKCFWHMITPPRLKDAHSALYKELIEDDSRTKFVEGKGGNPFDAYLALLQYCFSSWDWVVEAFYSRVVYVCRIGSKGLHVAGMKHELIAYVGTKSESMSILDVLLHNKNDKCAICGCITERKTIYLNLPKEIEEMDESGLNWEDAMYRLKVVIMFYEGGPTNSDTPHSFAYVEWNDAWYEVNDMFVYPKEWSDLENCPCFPMMMAYESCA